MQNGIVGTVRPVAEIIYQPMRLWIAMDVGHQSNEVVVVFYPLALKGILKQTACSLIGFVHGFGVSAKEGSILLGEIGAKFLIGV